MRMSNVILSVSMLAVGFIAGYPWGQVKQFSDMTQTGIVCQIDAAFPAVDVE